MTSQCILLSAVLPHTDPRIEWAADSLKKKYKTDILAYSGSPLTTENEAILRDLHSVYHSHDTIIISFNNAIPKYWYEYYFCCQLYDFLSAENKTNKIRSKLSGKLIQCLSKLRLCKRSPVPSINDSSWKSIYFIIRNHQRCDAILNSVLAHFTKSFFYLVSEFKKRDLKPNYLYCADLDTLFVGVYLKVKDPSIKLIFDAHEIYSASVHNASKLLVNFMEQFEDQLLNYTDKFISVSPQIVDYYLQKKPALNGKAFTVPNAAPYLDLFDPDNWLPKLSGKTINAKKGELESLIKNIEKIKDYLCQVYTKNSDIIELEEIDFTPLNTFFKRCFFNQHKVNFIIQGGLSEGRGISFFVRCWNELNPSNACLFLRGPISEAYKNHLKSLAHDTLEKSLFFLAPVTENNLVNSLIGADVGIIPYPPTTLNQRFCSPNKLGQYMQAELAVLACNTEFVTTIINKANVGLEYQYNDKASLKRQLMLLINNQDKLLKLKTNAKQYAKEHYCWQKYENTFLQAVD